MSNPFYLKNLQELKERAGADAALHAALPLLDQHPNCVKLINFVGAMYFEKRAYDTCLPFYQLAAKLDPANAEIQNTLGVVYRRNNEVRKALGCYEKALKLNPDYVEAHNNLAVALKDAGLPESALRHLHHAIKLSPNYSHAHNNLGLVYRDLSRFNDAIESFEKALICSPEYKPAVANLMETLRLTNEPKKSNNPIVSVHTSLSELSKVFFEDDTWSESKIVGFLTQCFAVAEAESLDLRTRQSQIFNQTGRNLNCSRHKAIFNQYNIIAKHCFGCFKVQVDFQSLLDLLRLTFASYTLVLPGNPIRKSMIEMREGVGGTYKAILFCNELEQAKQSATVLTGLTEACSYETKISIKRGCSEFAASFPQYKETNGDKFGSFLYPQQWAKIEDEFDEANPNILRRVNPSMPHVALHDLCIVRKWIDYAKGLGDASVPKFSTLETFYPHVEQEGAARRTRQLLVRS